MKEKVKQLVRSAVKYIVLPAGVFFILACLLAFTTAPFYLYHYFGTVNAAFHFEPQVIIQLGSTAMPSEQALIRCYYTRELARKYPSATLILSQLKAEDEPVEGSDAAKMKAEIQRGMPDSLPVYLLTDAHSTREEVLLIHRRFAGIRGKNIVLVTSPEHMMRAVAAFRRDGFRHVGGMPTFSAAGIADFRYREKSMGGRTITPEAGSSLQLRYQFWNHLRYEILCIREFLAFFWYRLKGWA